LPSNNSSTPDRRIMELEGRVKSLMKSYEAPKSLSQVSRITSTCKVCSGPHETHNCMELPKRAFNEFTSSHVGQGPRTSGEAYEAWKDKPNFKGYQTRSVSFNDSSPLTWSEHFPSQSIPRQSCEDALKKFILSQELQLSTLEAKFRQQQADVNNKICNLLTAIKEHVVNEPIHVDEVKSVTVISPPTSTVKIKSPSKLFKHLSPKGKEPANPLGPTHFVNTITTISAFTPNSTQQQTNKFGHIAKDETLRVDNDSARKPTDSSEQYTARESGKSDEEKERSEGHERNPTILGKSIIEEPERKMENVTSGSSDRTEEDNHKVFKISCTIKEKFLTDSHIDPSSPVNLIPLSLYHETFPKRIACERVMNNLSIRVGELVYNTDLAVVDDVDPLTNQTLTYLVLGKPFIEESGVILDEKDGSALFTNGVKKVIFRRGNEEVYEYRPSLEGNIY
jgi:hypothetical protein